MTYVVSIDKQSIEIVAHSLFESRTNNLSDLRPSPCNPCPMLFMWARSDNSQSSDLGKIKYFCSTKEK